MLGKVQMCSTCGQAVDVYCPAHPEARLEVIQIEQAMHLQRCSHCGQALSPDNIRLALVDIGGGVAIDRITLCCPGHIENEGCPAYRAEDHWTMAYWYMV